MAGDSARVHRYRDRLRRRCVVGQPRSAHAAGDAFGVLAGACWGATTVVVRASRLSEAPVTLTLFYQLIVGFLGLLLIALFSGQITHVSLTTVAVASVLFRGLVVSFFSYPVWF